MTRILTIVSAIGAGVVAGVLFAFSTFVMNALERLTSPQGIAAMQAINVAAPTPLFMLALFGTAATGGIAAVAALVRSEQPAATYLVIAWVLYLVVVIVTAAYHVPRNDALAKTDPTGATAASYWRHYVSGWDAWNHVRTIVGMAAATMFTLAARVQ